MNTKSVTLKDIAAELGLSPATVSLILNRHHGSFPKETVEKVLATAERMGYKRRSALSDENLKVMVVVTAITNYYYSDMVQNIEQAALDQNVEIVNVCTYHNPTMEEKFLQTAINDHYLGVVFLYPPDNVAAYEKAQKQIPIIALCNEIKEISGDHIQVNNFEAGRIAMQHLLDFGHTRIAVLTKYQQGASTSNSSRLAGMIFAAEQTLGPEHLLILKDESTCSDLLYTQNIQYEIGYKLAQDSRLIKTDITALICSNDLIAYGAMDYLGQKGFRFPEDFSIIGSDNLRFSAMPQISLTSVDMHMGTVATTALTRLLRRAMAERYSRIPVTTAHFLLQCNPNIVPRKSTGPVRK